MLNEKEKEIGQWVTVTGGVPNVMVNKTFQIMTAYHINRPDLVNLATRAEGSEYCNNDGGYNVEISNCRPALPEEIPIRARPKEISNNAYPIF